MKFLSLTFSLKDLAKEVVARVLSELNRKRPPVKDEKTCEWFITEEDLP